MAKKILLATVFLFVLSGFTAFAADLTQLVPETAAFIFSINMGKIVSSESVKKQIDDGLAKQTPDQKKVFDEFVQKTGIDPFKHLKEIVVFLSAKDPKAEKQEGGVLINGTFEVAKILDAIKNDEKAKQDVIVDKLDGLDVIKGKKETDMMGLFLDGNTGVVGANASVKAVIDVKNAKAKNITTNAAFANLLKKVDTSASVWGAGLIPQTIKDKLAEQAKNNPQTGPLAALNAIFFSFNFETDLIVNVTGEVDKKESMEALMTSVNGFLAMLKMLAGPTPEAVEILNMIKVEGADTAAKITLNVPKAKLDEVKKKIEERMKAGPGAPPSTPVVPAPSTPEPTQTPVPDQGK